MKTQIKFVILVAFFQALYCLQIAFAQDLTINSQQQTTPPPGARFEVVQSTLAAKWTFRLDRYTGQVWQLVRTHDDDNSWEEMEIQRLSKVKSPTRPRFLIFTSGLAAKHTFLLDADSGRTWQIVTAKRQSADGSYYEVTMWQPFAEN